MGHKRKHYDKTHSAGNKLPRSKRRNRDEDQFDEIDAEDLVYSETSYDHDLEDSDIDRSDLERRFQSRTHGPNSSSGHAWNDAPSTDDEEWDDFGYDFLSDFNDAG